MLKNRWRLGGHARRFGLMLSLAVIVLIVLGAVLAPVLAPYSPDAQLANGLSVDGLPQAPSWSHWFGTDNLGRSLLSRVLYGAQATLLVGIVSNTIAVLIGALIGGLAGMLEGRAQAAVMRFVDLMLAFPALILAIAIASVIGPSLWNAALIIALANWTWIARVAYTKTLSIKERNYMTAARMLGAGRWYLFTRHLLMHLAPIMLVWETLGIATTVQMSAALSFLGVGVQPPTPSWGNIIHDNQNYFTVAPWTVLIPGVFILALSLSFNIVGEYLHERMENMEARGAREEAPGDKSGKARLEELEHGG
ncbi:Dipeptide transport system permease protein DppC [Acidihalobacter prosperus]|uniref:Dipeptide transport system permease protein DppC n=2 Tax=Acidihalobacter prosperus TaxID=160660 RepID=A0A1A6C8W7_9GAMM|nr:Dipeptide transport system permease protein DppC [Acidihalobacter prosperus]